MMVRLQVSLLLVSLLLVLGAIAGPVSDPHHGYGGYGGYGGGGGGFVVAAGGYRRGGYGYGGHHGYYG